MGVITLFVVSVIIFLSMEFLPGDFGQAILGQSALPETVAAFRRELRAGSTGYCKILAMGVCRITG